MKVKERGAAARPSLADDLVMASIRLTRTLRALNPGSALSGPQLSLMAAVVYAGRIAARDLARLEEVTRATISRQISELERRGLVSRRRHERDTRAQWIVATARGRRLVADGHRRRLQPLTKALRALPADQREKLAVASRIIERITAHMKG